MPDGVLLAAARATSLFLSFNRGSRDTPRSTKATTWCVGYSTKSERPPEPRLRAPCAPVRRGGRARSGGVVRGRRSPRHVTAAEPEPFATAVIHSPGQFVERSSLGAVERVRECRWCDHVRECGAVRYGSYSSSD